MRRSWTLPSGDLVRCPVDPTQCDIQVNYTNSGNPDLKPEKSKQGTLGFVWAPVSGLTLYADYCAWT